MSAATTKTYKSNVQSWIEDMQRLGDKIMSTPDDDSYGQHDILDTALSLLTEATGQALAVLGHALERIDALEDRLLGGGA